MYHQVEAYIMKHNMLEQSDKVIAGVSGGADSICLLFMLLRLREELGYTLVVVHVHHGLRGKSADADAEYVKQICKEHKIELKIYREDVGAYGRERHLTIEEAGRDVRRRCFLDALNGYEGTKIALAHHQNDNVETMLWNLCRGAGIKGLGGMLPKNGVYIRPLLCLKRKDIESYLEERGISYCTDETNFEDVYTRNKVRNHMIPYMEEQINVRCVDHMAETMEQMRRLGEYVDQQAQEWEEKCTRIQTDGRAILKGKEYEKIPQALKPYVLYGIIAKSAGRRKDIEAVHVRMTEGLLYKQVGREVHLPYGLIAKRCYEGILFFKNTEKIKLQQEEKPQIVSRIFERNKEEAIFPETPYTKWFDYDIIKNTVKIRHREPGDYISIDHKGSTQKLKQYFINNKIPQNERDSIWLVADGAHIMWVVGYRQNQMYQVSEHTKRILEIGMNGGESNGGDS